MSENVVKFTPVEVGEGYRFNPDDLLDAAKGQPFDRLVIIGDLPNGELWVSGSANAGETLLLLKMAERRIVFGEG
jgi:hypothetical protein